MRLLRQWCILLIVCLNSCSKDNDPTAPAGTMIATVNDEAWQSTEALARKYSGGFSIIGGTDAEAYELVISGTTLGKYKVELSVSPEASLTARGPNRMHHTTRVYRLNAIEVGAATISEIDEMSKTISGTFSAEIPLPYHGNKIRVHHGSYHKIPYITQQPSDNNTFSAKVAGSDMGPTTITASCCIGPTFSLNFSAPDHEIHINLPDNIAKGSYQFLEANVSAKASYRSNSTSFSFPSGNIIITLHNIITRRIEGTFSFSVEPRGGGAPLAVTDGSFAVSY